MSSESGANARVSIPNSARKTIQNIKEIGVNHSDEDVYSMLKECNMDPNETVQRLLFIDTFHEVRRKRDKRKEIVNGRVLEDLRRKATNHVRGSRSRGSISSQHVSHDAGGGKYATFRKENGYEDRGKALKSPALPVLKEVASGTSTLMEKTLPAIVKDPTELPTGGVIVGNVVQEIESVDAVPQKDDTNAGSTKTGNILSQSTGNTLSANDLHPIPVQSCDPQLPTGVGAIKHEIKSLQVAVEIKDSVLAVRELGSSHELIDQTQTKVQHGAVKFDTPTVSSTRSENSEVANIVQSEIDGEILGSDEFSSAPVSDNRSAFNSLVNAVGPTKAVEELTSKLEKLKFYEGQHVILPNHIQVPDAVKNVLSFGSLGSCFGARVNGIVSSDSNGISNQASQVLVEDDNSNQASEVLVEDEIAKESESCDDDTPSLADEENCPDPPPASVTETMSPPENKAPVLKDDQLRQERLPAVVPQHAVVQPLTYTSGFMPPMLGSPPIPLEGQDHQAHLSNFMNRNSVTMSTPTPPPVQPAGAIPSSVVVSVQPVPLIRQPYPSNFFPYAHYLSPYFVPPAVQFVGHAGFPAPLPTVNMYMPPPTVTVPGMKASPPYKLGANVANQVPFPIPSGAYAVSSPQSVTSGVPNANEDLASSLLKENGIYLGQQSEGSTVWIPGPDRDSANLPINSFYNLPSPSQHIAVAPQPFAAVYHHPFLQQSQPLAGPVESVGPPPPPNAFQQQPQRHPINWNNGF